MEEKYCVLACHEMMILMLQILKDFFKLKKTYNVYIDCSMLN